MVSVDDKITPALIALVGAIFIQAVVVPWNQRRTRRREKWQDDVTLLEDIASNELSAVADRVWAAADALRFWMLLKGDDEFPAEAVEQQIKDARAEQASAEQAARDVLTKIKRLETRVKRMRPRAPFWRRLRMRQLWLQMALIDLRVSYKWSSRELLPDDEEWAKHKKRYTKAIEDFVKLVSELEDRDSPPPRELALRTKEFLGDGIPKATARVRASIAGIAPALKRRRSRTMVLTSKPSPEVVIQRDLSQ